MKTVAFVRGTGIFNDSRSTKEIMALIEAGYRVEVLGWDRDGTACEQCNKAFASVSEYVNFSFFDVRAENGIGIKNIDKLIGWLKWVVKTLNRIDNLWTVHACDLDAGIAARLFCKKHKIKLVYDIFDYYVDCHHIPAILRSFVEQLEIKTINFADVTIICTEERKEQIAKSEPKKIIVIHNSPEVDEMSMQELTIDYFYCGTMSGRRLISETLEEYANNVDLKMIFGGYGPYAEMAIELSKKYDDFSFVGTIPYSRVLSMEAQSRVLSAIYEPTIRNHRLCAPNKFYEALALGKPVIVCRGTGIDKIVEDNDIGCVIDYDAKQFYEALRKLKTNDELRKHMGIRARKLYDEKYSWSIMKSRLLKLYSELD